MPASGKLAGNDIRILTIATVRPQSFGQINTPTSVHQLNIGRRAYSQNADLNDSSKMIFSAWQENVTDASSFASLPTF